MVVLKLLKWEGGQPGEVSKYILVITMEETYVWEYLSIIYLFKDLTKQLTLQIWCI